ncbi:ABC transporter ATP-binding protein [Caulobacter sp. S45]|uniref:ABC transporter ATP-binding protein n=1 Tax=Caulobacter sp. S45 TaxID=1641861 RepID=UPI0015752D0C|nr:ABC transporter ATP-binding protein [Caulobacter sp. S45]
MSGLRLVGVSVKREGRTVLTEASAAFPPGSLTAVIGPNGAGKSTLLAVAAGLLKPHAGALTLDGRPLETFGRQALARRRAYLPQSPRADWPISVERVVALGLTPYLPAFGRLPDELETQVETALRSHDLLALRHRRATELSGGELSRTMLARAVVGDPDLLLVDEPTAGLDPRHALDAAHRLGQRAQAGRTVAMAIHDLHLALRFADQVVALKDGCILAAGPLREVLDEPLLRRLYDMPARLIRDPDGVSVRFLG